MGRRTVCEAFANLIANLSPGAGTDVNAGLVAAGARVRFNLPNVDETHVDPTESIVEAFRRRY